MKMGVHCTMHHVTDFNDRIVAVRRDRSPYSIMHAGLTLDGKIMHKSTLDYLRAVIDGTGAAVEFEIRFDDSDEYFSLFIADFHVGWRIMSRTCKLNEGREYPEQQPSDDDEAALSKIVSDADATEFRRFSRAFRAIRKMESYRYFFNAGQRELYLFPHIDDAARLLTLTTESQPRLLHRIFFGQSGVLEKLVDNPFQTAEALLPVACGSAQFTLHKEQTHHSALRRGRTSMIRSSKTRYTLKPAGGSDVARGKVGVGDPIEVLPLVRLSRTVERATLACQNARQW